MNDPDFATNAITLLGLFGAFISLLGACELLACTWNWLHGQGFRE